MSGLSVQELLDLYDRTDDQPTLREAIRKLLVPTKTTSLNVERLRQALINVNGHIGSGNADSIAAEYDSLARLEGALE